jgi:hypothetical protein
MYYIQYVITCFTYIYIHIYTLLVLLCIIIFIHVRDCITVYAISSTCQVLHQTCTKHVQAAARLASAHDFVQNFPAGYDARPFDKPSLLSKRHFEAAVANVGWYL